MGFRDFRDWNVRVPHSTYGCEVLSVSVTQNQSLHDRSVELPSRNGFRPKTCQSLDLRTIELAHARALRRGGYSPNALDARSLFPEGPLCTRLSCFARYVFPSWEMNSWTE